MPADSKPLPAFDPSVPAFDPSVMALLACPACHGGLSLAAGTDQQAARLVCVECGRAYPIVDGIPVLIAAPAQNKPSSQRTL